MHFPATAQTPDITPLISVVVPFYNVEECVADCLDSLINQTFDSYEVVCIDDGSTDGTAQLLDDYAALHANVRVFHFENAGLSVARNRGVELAQAELISFVDGDDFVSPHYLSALYRAYDNVPGRLVQAGRVTGTRGDLKATEWPATARSSEPEILSGDDLRHAYLMGRLPDAAWARLAHRSLYLDVPFVPGMLYEERMAMPDVIEHVTEMAILDQAVYAYVVRAGSITYPRVMTQKEPRDYFAAMRHMAAVVSRWDKESHDLLSWRIVTMALPATIMSSEIPDPRAARQCAREATGVIRCHLPQALSVRQRYSLSWRPIALCVLALVSPSLYRHLRNARHRMRALSKHITPSKAQLDVLVAIW